jgi:hypothetical protein
MEYSPEAELAIEKKISAVTDFSNAVVTRRGYVRIVNLLKLGIWVYFLLIITEGALRKWFLPGLATPLLIVRDPVALWILCVAGRYGLIPKSPYLSCMIFIGVIAFFTTLFFGHGNLPVAIYGARILLIHFPLMFVMGRVFTRKDVLKLGLIVLWITGPMTMLIGLQFFSPQAAWVNHVAGGIVEEKGFQGALGHFRPPGTFSFVTGTYLFYGLASCFIFYYWFNSERVSRLLLISATFSLLVAVPLSISRTLLFEVVITIVFSIIAVSRKPKYMSKMFVSIIVAFVGLLIMSKTSFFQHATETFFSRFTNASQVEGGLEGTLGDRFLGGLVSAITGSFNQAFFGAGIGIGTNVGSQLLAGSRGFLVHEEEWGRTVDELGPLLGLGVLFIRVCLAAKFAIVSYNNLKLGDMLPWLLLSFGFLSIAQGNWAQPTSLGFCTLIGGLMFASFNK